jgi:thiopeptide-type bacteriocin biosynthesis protein
MEDYHFFPVCLLRTPSFSYKNYNEKNLAVALQDRFFQDALLIASPILYRELEKLAFDLARLNAKQRITVIKYFNRICFRPTPFGMFSSFSPVNWGADDWIIINKQQVHISAGFSDGFLAGKQLRGFLDPKKLKYTLNHSIYTCGQELRFLVSRLKDQDKGWSFTLESINHLPVLKNLISFCKQQRSYNELLDFLTTTANIPTDDANGLLSELIDLQFLVDELVPNITGADYLKRLIGAGYPAQLLPIPQQAILSAPDNQLSKADSLFIHDSSIALNELYVNTEGTASGTLNFEHQDTILNALNALQTLKTTANMPANLKTFITNYEKKFTDRTIPLLLALDPEMGIGYQNLTADHQDNPLSSEIKWPGQPTTGNHQWSAVSSLLLKKWHECAQDTGSDLPELTLQDTDLALLPPSATPPKTPNTLSVIFRAVGDKIYMEDVGGASATALLGRFTPLNEDTDNLVKNIVGHEVKANPDVIFAEITHICDFHTANINRRQQTFAYEIPVLTSSTADPEFQLPLSDLYISVINHEIILFSGRHQKRVIPRLSSALNYTRNDLAVFQFLCDLQYQNIATSFSFDLMNYFPDLDFYPRVTYQNAILSPATWRLTKADIKETLEAPIAQQTLFFKKLRRKLKLPRWVSYTVHDHQLVFDFNQRMDLELFLNTVSNKDHFLIKEYLHSQRQTDMVTNGSKPLINQFIAPVFHNKEIFKGIKPAITDAPGVKRKLPPGSEWLYFKVYCHPTRSNAILTEHIQLLIHSLYKKNLISEWFFVRYNDPDHHLRLRFKLKNAAFADAISTISNHLGNLLKNQKITNYQVDIYERELERYGYQHIDMFERVFFFSSQLIMQFISRNEKQETPLAYHDFGLLTVRSLMSAFELSGQHRINFLEQVYTSFFHEFNGESQLKYQLDLKYRKLEKSISLAMVHESEIVKNLGITGLQIQYQQQVQGLYAALKNKPTAVINKWLADIIHMHLNRLFTDDARKQEFILYHLLLKFEKAQLARENRNNSILA